MGKLRSFVWVALRAPRALFSKLLLVRVCVFLIATTWTSIIDIFELFKYEIMSNRNLFEVLVTGGMF